MIRALALFPPRQLTTFRSLAAAPSLRCAASTATPAEEEHQLKARPFSEMPTPDGAVPLLGHLPLLRRNSGKKRLELFQSLFKSLGPVFKLKLTGIEIILLQWLILTLVVSRARRIYNGILYTIILVLCCLSSHCSVLVFSSSKCGGMLIMLYEWVYTPWWTTSLELVG